jgi:hypothetical protein
MRNFKHLLWIFIILVCNDLAQAQQILSKHTFRSSIFSLPGKERIYKNKSSHSKKEEQKKLASYTYIGMDFETGAVTDTSEKYVITWGNNGLPAQMVITGKGDQFIPGKTVPFRLTYTNFVEVNTSSFQWFNEDFTFEPRNGLLEVYDNAMWQNFSKNEKTVSAQGVVQAFQAWMWVSGSWENNIKETYTYDVHGRQIESLEQEWMAGTWVNKSRFQEFYDADGRSIGYLGEEWEGNGWVSRYGSRLMLTKNASNQVVTAVVEEVDGTGAWAPTSRQTYEWNTAGELVKATEESFTAGEWMYMAEYRDIKWKSFDAKSTGNYPIFLGGTNYASYDSYYFNSFDSTWVLNTRVTNIFSGEKIVESITTQSMGMEMDTTGRTTYTYYPNGDMKESTGWYKSNGEWLIQYGNGNNNIYDADGDIIRNAGTSWNMDSGKFVEQFIQLYTYTHVTAGIARATGASQEIKLYPNPVTGDQLTLHLPSSARATITVLDITGRAIKQMEANTIECRITIGDLSKGTYIIHVNQAGKIFHSRFIAK